MQGETCRQSVCVKNPQGFHMRPMAAFVAAANRFDGAVTVHRDGTPPANGKSILSLMGLVAVQGTDLVIEVSGPNAQATLNDLVAVFEANFDEE
jgi:phosphocarrier protein HPr